MGVYEKNLPNLDAHQGQVTGDILALRCNEAAGANFTDSSGGGKTITQVNTPGAAGGLYEDTITTGARTFNGSTQYGVRAVHDSDEGALQAAHTVCAWVKPGTFSGSMCVVDFSAAGETQAANTQTCLILNSASLTPQILWEYGAGTNGGATCPVSNTLAANETHHVAVVVEDDPDNFNKKRARFYVDGELKGIVGNLTPPDGGTTAVWGIGRRSDTASNYFNGTIDDVQVYSFAATDHFIRDAYARGVKDWRISPAEMASYGSDFAWVSTNGIHEKHVRVLIEDRFDRIDMSTRRPDGMVDITSLFGFNWLVSAEWDEDSESLARTATVKLIESIGEFSVSPEKVRNSFAPVGPAEVIYSNPLNYGDGTFPGQPWLLPNARVWIEVAVVPAGYGRIGAAPFFMLAFEGFVEKVDTEGGVVTLGIVDNMARLLDVWIEPDKNGEDRGYGSLGGVEVEDVAQAIIDDNDPAVFDIISVDDVGTGGRIAVTVFGTTVGMNQGKPHLFAVGDRVLLAGTGVGAWDGEHTVWAVTDDVVTLDTVAAGAASTTGTMRGLESEHGYIGGKPVLWTASGDLGYAKLPHRVTPTQNVASALEEQVAPIGFAARFIWHDFYKQFQLRFVSGLGTGSSTASHMIRSAGFSRDKERERSGVIVEYNDSASIGTFGDQEWERKLVASMTTNDRAVFRRRIGRVGNASNSLINTAAEAQVQADNYAGSVAGDVPILDVDMLWPWWLAPGQGAIFMSENALDADGVRIYSQPQIFDDGRVMCVESIRTVADINGISSKTRWSRRSSTYAMQRKITSDIMQAKGRVPGKGTKPCAVPTSWTARTISVANVAGTQRIRGFELQITTSHLPDQALGLMWDLFELHISTSNGFTPAYTTLVDSTRGNRLIALGLTASTTYYYRVKIRDRAGNTAITTQNAIAIPADA